LPSLYTTRSGGFALGATFGLSLTGTDRLGKHTWAINASYDTIAGGPSVQVGYGNYQLAPWFLALVASRNVSLGTTDTSVSLSGSRPLWTSGFSAGFDAIDHREAGDLLPA